jgi:hypothetical protein
MAGITTSNVTLTPQGGWTQLATGATSFLRLSKIPHNQPVFLGFGASPPTPGTGFRWDCHDIFFECAIGVAVWGRILETSTDKVIVSVFND